MEHLNSSISALETNDCQSNPAHILRPHSRFIYAGMSLEDTWRTGGVVTSVTRHDETEPRGWKENYPIVPSEFCIMSESKLCPNERGTGLTMASRSNSAIACLKGQAFRGHQVHFLVMQRRRTRHSWSAFLQNGKYMLREATSPFHLCADEAVR